MYHICWQGSQVAGLNLIKLPVYQGTLFHKDQGLFHKFNSQAQVQFSSVLIRHEQAGCCWLLHLPCYICPFLRQNNWPVGIRLASGSWNSWLPRGLRRRPGFSSAPTGKLLSYDFIKKLFFLSLSLFSLSPLCIYVLFYTSIYQYLHILIFMLYLQRCCRRIHPDTSNLSKLA